MGDLTYCPSRIISEDCLLYNQQKMKSFSPFPQFFLSIVFPFLIDYTFYCSFCSLFCGKQNHFYYYFILGHDIANEATLPLIFVLFAISNWINLVEDAG